MEYNVRFSGEYPKCVHQKYTHVEKHASVGGKRIKSLDKREIHTSFVTPFLRDYPNLPDRETRGAIVCHRPRNYDRGFF